MQTATLRQHPYGEHFASSAPSEGSMGARTANLTVEAKHPHGTRVV
jgi:hypothetical protein